MFYFYFIIWLISSKFNVLIKYKNLKNLIIKYEKKIKIVKKMVHPKLVT